ncbi:acylphosphatase [Planctomycetota bacterium]
MNERRTLYFTGHVQGVGFRYTTQRIARNFEVVGYVQNLPDGRVCIVAEGSSAELAAFVSQIQSTLSEYVSDVTMERTSATREFDSFSIRR